MTLFVVTKRLSSFLISFLFLLAETAQAQVETDFSAGGAVKIGDSTTPCAPSIAGSLRYDADGTTTVDFCNGMNWLNILTSTTGGGIVNNGNSIGTMTIGTNDASSLNFETGGTTRATLTTGGFLGIGTTNPTQALHVHGKVAVTGSGTPTLSSCGSSGLPVVSGNDTRGNVTMGNGNPTACTLTFNSAFTTTPVCVVTSNHSTAGISVAITTLTTTGFTLTLSAGTNGYKFNYICLQ